MDVKHSTIAMDHATVYPHFQTSFLQTVVLTRTNFPLVVSRSHRLRMMQTNDHREDLSERSLEHVAGRSQSTVAELDVHRSRSVCDAVRFVLETFALINFHHRSWMNRVD